MVQVVSLTGTLTDAGEDGVTSVSLGDVVDELLDKDGLADSGTAKKSNLATTGVRGKEVDNLDAGLKDLSSRRLVDEGRGVGVDRQTLDALDGWERAAQDWKRRSATADFQMHLRAKEDARPRSSMGSPMTFMMRPRHAGPTGMVMGAPVSTTLVPRTC